MNVIVCDDFSHCFLTVLVQCLLLVRLESSSRDDFNVVKRII